MKKFTKGCLMTALVLFLVGLMLCVVCGVLGGFRQLAQMDGIGSIPFVCGRDDSGHWRIGFFRSPGYGRDDLEDIGDIDVGDIDVGDIDVGDTEDAGELERRLRKLDGKQEELALTAETLGSLEIDLVMCNLLIQESADEHVWILVEGDTNRPEYAIENDGNRSRLCIENDEDYNYYWRSKPKDYVYLWLPKGCALKECEIYMGAGYMKSISLNADQSHISVGAGLMEIAGLAGKEIILSADAGELLAGRVTAENAVLQIGAGHLSVEELSVSRNADISVGVGQCEIAGTITGDLDLDCDMGETMMRLTGSEDDHSYDVECGMGEVNVGSRSHSGVAVERSWNSGKDSEFDVDCNMGTVTITFEE